MLKVSTWNVNGIRAREREVLDFIAREQPDVLCLQEIKASPEHVPDALARSPATHATATATRATPGVALLLSRAAFPARPAFRHPEFDHETAHRDRRVPATLVFASIYVPNGGKDYPAKVRFLDALDAYAEVARRRAASGWCCAAI